MRTRLQRFLIWVGLSVLIASCETGGSGVQVPAPDIEVTCTGGKCAGVSGLRDVVINITSSGCAPDQIDYEAVAAATGTVLCNGSSCSGTVSTWNTSSVESRTYYICGWIDINNTSKDSADAFSENYQFVSGSTISMTNWSVTYTFSQKNTKNK